VDGVGIYGAFPRICTAETEMCGYAVSQLTTTLGHPCYTNDLFSGPSVAFALRCCGCFRELTGRKLLLLSTVLRMVEVAHRRHIAT
jgi:hypothetical protein